MVEVGDCQLYCGDSYEILAELNVVADAFITDPPYGMTDAEWDTQGLDGFRFWQLAESKSKQSSNYVLFGCGKFSIDLINSKREWFRYDLTWQKTSTMGFMQANLMPLRSHESVYIFGQPGFQKSATYNPIKTYNSHNVGRVFGGWAQHMTELYGKVGSCPFVSDGWMHPRSVITFALDRNGKERGLHPTQKPLLLMEWLVKTYTNEGDLVIDPFMGSGSTGVACVRLGRKFLGIEKDEEYFKTAVERITRERKSVEVSLFD